MTEVLKGRKTPRKARRPKVFSARRVCQTHGCDTILSRYNGRDQCHAHAPLRFPRVRGHLPRKPQAEPA